MKKSLILLLFLLAGIQTMKAQEDRVQLLKDKVVNNYLNYLAQQTLAPSLLQEIEMVSLDLPNCYKPYVEVSRLDSGLQVLSDLNITLYEYSDLGYAYRMEADTFNKMDYQAYIIEKSGFVLHSGVSTHRGIIGYSEDNHYVLFFSGPLLLHDVALVTVNQHLDTTSLIQYLNIKYYSDFISSIKINEEEIGQSYCIEFTIKDDQRRCLFVRKDPLSKVVKLSETSGCNCF